MNKKLVEIVAEMFFIDEAEVTPELTAEMVDTWDSLNHLRLITALEVEFGIKFSMTEIQSLENVSQLDALITQHTK